MLKYLHIFPKWGQNGLEPLWGWVSEHSWTWACTAELNVEKCILCFFFSTVNVVCTEHLCFWNFLFSFFLFFCFWLTVSHMWLVSGGEERGEMKEMKTMKRRYVRFTCIRCPRALPEGPSKLRLPPPLPPPAPDTEQRLLLGTANLLKSADMVTACYQSGILELWPWGRW